MKKILYIEDEWEYIELVKESIKAHPYEIIPAKDGEEGLKKIKEDKPDLILLDLFLPGMRGFDVCKRLKEDPQTKDIPIIVITASGVEYLEDQCKDAGIEVCIRKPYRVAELVAHIKAILKE